jgi:hypothetical protein
MMGELKSESLPKIQCPSIDLRDTFINYAVCMYELQLYVSLRYPVKIVRLVWPSHSLNGLSEESGLQLSLQIH